MYSKFLQNIYTHADTSAEIKSQTIVTFMQLLRDRIKYENIEYSHIFATTERQTEIRKYNHIHATTVSYVVNQMSKRSSLQFDRYSRMRDTSKSKVNNMYVKNC